MKNILQLSFTFLIIPILLLITYLPKGLSQVTKTAIVFSTLPDVTVVVTEQPPVANPTDTINIPGNGGPGGPAGPAPPGGAPQQPGAPQPPNGPPANGPPANGPPPNGPPPNAPQPNAPQPPTTPPPGAPQPPNNTPSPGGQQNSPTDSSTSTPTVSATNLLTGHVPVPSTRPNGGNIIKWNLIEYSVIIGGLIMGVLVLY